MGLIVSLTPPIAQVRINRPSALNALDLVSFRELDALIDRVNADHEFRVLIISAEGKRAFSSGADIKDLRDITAEEAKARAEYRRNVLQKLSELDVPSVAVIDGLAMGGGVELAAACTFRLATAQAVFSMPEINLGLLPGAGATQRLPHLVGSARALEMMLTARRIDAQEALQWGLITRIVADLDKEVAEFVAELTRKSRSAMRGVLRSVRRGEDLPMREGLSVEGEELSELSLSPDGIEGVTAFFEKRQPRFNQPF